MSDRQQVRTADVKKTSSTKQHLSSKNIPSHHTHPAATIQRARTDPGSLTPADVLQLQRTIGNQAVGQLLAEIGRLPSTTQQVPVQRQELEEEELLQGKMIETVQRQGPEEEEEELLQGKMMDTVQRQAPEEEELMQGKFASGLTGTLQAKGETPPNRTGMPDHLKAGIETLSGTAMDDVKVHYNSAKPAHVQALAYTQSTDIHVGPGQEKHLPHEAWHVVQQSQGRVKPTLQLRGVAINDDHVLEREADVMGERAGEIGQDVIAHDLTQVVQQTAADIQHQKLDKVDRSVVKNGTIQLVTADGKIEEGEVVRRTSGQQVKYSNLIGGCIAVTAFDGNGALGGHFDLFSDRTANWNQYFQEISGSAKSVIINSDMIGQRQGWRVPLRKDKPDLNMTPMGTTALYIGGRLTDDDPTKWLPNDRTDAGLVWAAKKIHILDWISSKLGVWPRHLENTVNISHDVP